MAETQVRVRITGDSREAQLAVDRLRRNFSGLRDDAAALTSKLGAIGVGLSVAGLASSFRSAVRELDSFNDAAESTGISVEKLSGLVQELAPAGVSLEQISDLAGKMSRVMSGADDETGKAAEAMRALGVASVDASGNLRPVDDVLREVAQSLAQYEDGTNKTAIAQALFGKSGASLIPVLNDIAQTTGAVGNVTAEMAQRAELAERQINALSRAALDLRNEIAAALIPSLLNAVEQFQAGTQAAGGFFAALTRYGLASPFEGPGEFINQLIEKRIELTARLAKEEALASGQGGAFGRSSRTRAGENAERLRGELAQLERDLTYFRTLQRQQADFGAGNLDARDLRNRPAARPEAPRLTSSNAPAAGRTAIDTAQREAEAIARVYDQQIKALFATRDLTAAQKLALDQALQAAPLEVRASIERAESAANLADIYRETAAEREAAIKAATATEEADYRAISKLNEQAREEREKLAAGYRELLDPLEQYRSKLREITRLEALGGEYGLTSDEAQRAREIVIEQIARAEQGFADLSRAGSEGFASLQEAIEQMSDKSADAISQFAISGKGSFKDLVNSILADLLRVQIRESITKPLKGALPDLFGTIVSAIGFGASGGTGILPGDSALALTGADIRGRRASGGNVQAGYPYMVGERGTPEVMVPSMDGTVLPYELLRAALHSRSQQGAPMSQPVVVNQVLNVGQGADYAMVRQAAALGAAQAQAQFIDARRRGQRWAA